MNKHNQNGSAQVIIISLVALILVGALGYVLWNNVISNKSPSAAEVASQKNLKVINDARYNKNPDLCEKISGGIFARDISSQFVYGAFTGLEKRDLSESEARAQCKKSVSDILDR